MTAAIGLNGWFGGYYDETDFEPRRVEYARPDAPPFLIANGNLDTDIPVEQARAFSHALRGASDSVVAYVELPGGRHAFDLFHSPRFESVIDGVGAFATAVRSARNVPSRRGRPSA